MTRENLPRDDAFRLLSHVYRRALLECLDRRDDPLALADAATAVARDCANEPIAAVPDEEIRRIYLSLHHTHVPKLADADAVSYDREEKLVALTERGERIVTVGDRLAGTDSVEPVDPSG